jgi:valyl-tRNA synthetase
MIEKNYQPADIEGRMSRIWEESGAFRAGRPERRDAKPFTIVIPPPNVTGSLHMGHALNNTLQDILCRFERMRGRDVLWQPGTDHAGIATQMVVERQLMERQQPGRRDMGRAKFLERVWQWKAESGGVIVNQLKRLGASCDWSRERFTMDEGLSRAVVKVFVELHREGAGELGSEAADGDLGSRGAAGRGQGQSLVFALSAGRPDLQSRRSRDVHRGRYDAARDDARRQRGGGASGR